jgi:serine/threonine-protein kinase
MRRTRQLGRYHVTERIAFGGMAEIFRGFTFEADGYRRDVAIKKVLPHFAEDRQFIDMLTDEFRLVSCLRHPNIAEVYELAKVDDSILIAMEFVDGKDLRSVVEREKALGGGLLEMDDSVYVVARALDGLHHAHTARDHDGHPLLLVHRDFSPSNLLVAYDGNVKICDFGIAKASHNKVQTKTGIIKGKVKYMSPEQAFGRKLDGRSDVFSAGSVLYELLCGQAAFQAATEVDLIFAVRDALPRPIREVEPRVPEALAAIVERAMVRSRSGRYQSALEFRDALLAWLAHAAPQYRRTKLARVMKRLFATEIEAELRAMEDFVVDVVAPTELGKNLIADALGPGAAYARFSPSPTRVTRQSSKGGGEFADVDDESSLPPIGGDDPLHVARTEILNVRAVPTSKRKKSARVPLAEPQPTRPVVAEDDPMLDEKTNVAPPPARRR